MARLIIEIQTTHIDGPRADASCYPGEIEAELEGLEIEAQDPDKDDPEVIGIKVKRIELAR